MRLPLREPTTIARLAWKRCCGQECTISSWRRSPPTRPTRSAACAGSPAWCCRISGHPGIDGDCRVVYLGSWIQFAISAVCSAPKGRSVRQGEPQRRTDAGELGGEPPLIFRTKAQMVYEQLRDWIVRGKLQPGESVDQERLAGLLDVSRMPLRQALLRLESDRLIERQPHHTGIVTDLSVSDID